MVVVNSNEDAPVEGRDGWEKAGLAHEAASRLGQAIHTFEAAFSEDPSRSAAAIHLVRVCHAAGDPKAALRWCRTAVALVADNPSLRLNLGWLHFEVGDHAAAIEQARILLDQAPDLAGASYRLLVFSYGAADRWKEAGEALDALHDIDAPAAASVAAESLSTFEARVVERLTKKRFRAAYDLLEHIPARMDWKSSPLFRDLKTKAAGRRGSLWGASRLVQKLRRRLYRFLIGRHAWLATGLLSSVLAPPRDPPPLRITVVTPVLNNADTLRETIESVVTQENVELEYIVVDGGSTDGSLAIIREYESRIDLIISEPDNGMYDAIGKGFDRATGDILAYLNADDVYEHGALEHALDAFKASPSRRVIYFDNTVTSKGWRFPNKPQSKVGFIALFNGHILFQDGVFFTRGAYRFVGGVNRTLKLAGDWELWTRLAYHFRLHRIDGQVSSFRLRPGQLSARMNAYFAEMEQARDALRAHVSPLQWIMRTPRHLANMVSDRLRSLSPWRSSSLRLFFPVASFEAPPGRPPPFTPNFPRCPIDDTPPTRFLFASRAPGGADSPLVYVYHHADAGTVSMYPPHRTAKASDVRIPDAVTRAEAPIAAASAFSGPTDPYDGFRPASYVHRLLLHPRLLALVRRWMAQDVDGGMQADGLVDGELRLFVDPFIAPEARPLRVLDLGCGAGEFLDRVAARYPGARTVGIEADATKADLARGGGHDVFTAAVEDVYAVLGQDMRFDLVRLSIGPQLLARPLDTVIRIALHLAPEGLLLLRTPNLDSAQIDLFGPAWCHWRPHENRHVFSPQSLRRMADCAQFAMVCCRSMSTPDWTRLSLGRARQSPANACVPAGSLDGELGATVAGLSALNRIYFDRIGRGDYLQAVFRKSFARQEQWRR